MKRRAEASEHSFEQSSDDSDDSVDIPRPEIRGPVEAHSTGTSAFSRQYGIGAKLMQDMGYTAGQGLGASGQGIVQPIKQQQRVKNSGLGSVQPQDIESHPPVPKEHRRLAAVQAEIHELESALRALHSKSAGDLDIVRFYSTFGHLKAWQTAKLAEILEIAGSTQLGRSPLALFHSEPIVISLLVLKEALHPNRYAALLNSVWLPKVAASLKSDLQQTMHFLLDQLLGLGNSILAPVLPALSELLVAHTAVIHGILGSDNQLDRWLKVVPALANELYIALFKRKLIPEEITDAEARRLCAALDSSKAMRLASAYVSGDLYSRWEKLEQWKSVCESREILVLMLEYQILPLWYEELVDLVKANQLTLKWWSDWRSRLPSNDPTVRSWLLRGLNTINADYDLGPEEVASTGESVIAHSKLR